MNTFGQIFRLTSFGESHGPAVGGVIDGMPALIDVDEALLRQEMARRRPGQSALTTSRNEPDEVELLSGIFEGKTTGTPIGFIVRNRQQHSHDYDNLRHLYRPSHADYTYQQKYGIRDHRGGGRSSARETLTRCVAGAFAKMALNQLGIHITAYTSQVGTITVDKPYTGLDLSLIESNAVRCPDPQKAAEMEALIRQVRSEGDSVGGVITCVAKWTPQTQTNGADNAQNTPSGLGDPVLTPQNPLANLGDPVFNKLQANLAAAMFSINAVKGFEYGLGFKGSEGRGSEQNDIFVPANLGGITTLTNRSGGIQGGISNGQDIYFRVAFKPVATILRDQQTVSTDGQPVTFKAQGRHDPCVVPRAVPVVEAMTACVLLDSYLLNKTVHM